MWTCEHLLENENLHGCIQFSTWKLCSLIVILLCRLVFLRLMMELYWERTLIVSWRNIFDSCRSTWNLWTYSMMLVPQTFFFLATEALLFSVSSHFRITVLISFTNWISEYWRRIELCRLYIRRRLDRCWTWSPRQQEEWIYPNIICLRKLLDVVPPYSTLIVSLLTWLKIALVDLQLGKHVLFQCKHFLSDQTLYWWVTGICESWNTKLLTTHFIFP